VEVAYRTVGGTGPDGRPGTGIGNGQDRVKCRGNVSEMGRHESGMKARVLGANRPRGSGAGCSRGVQEGHDARRPWACPNCAPVAAGREIVDRSSCLGWGSKLSAEGGDLPSPG
jgi:hypothetical protein